MDFLGGCLKVDCIGRLDMSCKNVNWNKVVNERKQKVVRFVHWFSYNSRQVKRAVIIGAIHRIVVNSSSIYNMIQAIFKFIVELRLLEYPWKVILSVIDQCEKKKQHLHTLWYHLRTLVMLIK